MRLLNYIVCDIEADIDDVLIESAKFLLLVVRFADYSFQDYRLVRLWMGRESLRRKAFVLIDINERVDRIHETQNSLV